jgi:hypothetical protein
MSQGEIAPESAMGLPKNAALCDMSINNLKKV